MAQTQTRFRWRNDDGSQTTATWKAAENANVAAYAGTNVRLRCQVAATGDPPPTSYTLYYKRTTDSTWQPVPVRKLAGLTPTPAQSAAIMYTDPNPADPRYANMITYYGHPGGLVVAGRDNFNMPAFATVAAAGGTVLIYLDAMLDNPYGRYHNYLLGRRNNGTPDATYGALVPRWPPGTYQANSTGYLADFRVGGILQSKLEDVLERMVIENPHMGGFFMDDVGSRSTYPLFNWDTFGLTNQQDYRAGAIAMCQTARRVCDRHGLIFFVNGVWQGWTNPTDTDLIDVGGGYPNVSLHGCSLADGAFVEHHPAPELPFWTDYAKSLQWASESATTDGTAFIWSVVNTVTDRDAYIADGNFAFVAIQGDSTPANYATPPIPYSTLHPTGLPSHVGGGEPLYIAATPNIPRGGGGTTRQLTAP